jgi:hypothetical protein
MLLSAGESFDSIAKVVCMWHFAQRGSPRAASEHSIGDGCYVAGDERSREVAVWASDRLVGLQCMVRLVGKHLRLCCVATRASHSAFDDPWDSESSCTRVRAALWSRAARRRGARRRPARRGIGLGAARMRLVPESSSRDIESLRTRISTSCVAMNTGDEADNDAGCLLPARASLRVRYASSGAIDRGKT